MFKGSMRLSGDLMDKSIDKLTLRLVMNYNRTAFLSILFNVHNIIYYIDDHQVLTFNLMVSNCLYYIKVHYYIIRDKKNKCVGKCIVIIIINCRI